MLNSKSNVRNIGDILGKIPSSFTFQDPVLIDAPNTVITDLSGNPRQIADPSKTIRPSLGIERVSVQALVYSDSEIGPNGEAVFKWLNDDRIRFVGRTWLNLNDTSGSRASVLAGTTGEYIEISFFGTGLNILDSSGISRGLVASVDGGAEGANILPDVSSIQTNRNYRTNIIYPVVSGLTLGNHTVRLRKSASGFSIQFYGFEILNESTQIKVPQGELFSNGLKYTNSALQSLDYNSGFDGNPALNGRGGRVIEYILPDGRLSKAIQQTNASQANLNAADHSDEELIRKINFREFGANRSDDFSTLGDTVTSRSFVLEDGTTTLLGEDVRVFNNANFTEYPGVYVNATGAAGGMTITFFGTGIDFLCTFGSSPETITIFVNGTSIGNMSFDTLEKNKLKKVVSGLPLGTHTVRLERGGGSSNFMSVSDFFIYGPKKPAIPVNAREIQEYYLLASYDGTTATTGATKGDNVQKPRGIIHKPNLKESLYVGSYSLGAQDADYPSGFYIFSTTNGNYIEYTFWGTGVNIHLSTSSAGTFTFTTSIDGALNATGVGRVNISNGGGGSYSCTSTAVGAPARLEFTGLTLGKHTVRVTRTGGAGNFGTFAFDIITPIYFPDTKTGSLSMGPCVQLKSSEDVSGIDLSKAKAWVVFDQVNNFIKSSYNVAAILNFTTGASAIYFEKPFKNPNYSFSGVAHVSAANVGVSIFNTALELNKTRNFARIAVGTGAANANEVCLVFFGELEDEE